ncbi:MAG: hypothetical protein ACI9RZ_001393, partial [Sphingobacteriales bacterium]
FCILILTKNNRLSGLTFDQWPRDEVPSSKPLE